MAYCPEIALSSAAVVHRWGKEWSKKLIKCDSMVVVEVLNSCYSRDREMMHLLRWLFFIAEHFHITVHLPGKENEWTDALSCNNIPGFLQVSAGAATTPTHLPSQALALLVEKQPDWTSSGHNCQLYRHELAQSTHCTYASRKRHYLNFCGRLSVPTLPTSEGQLCYFVGFLNNQVLLHQTVKSYLSEVCYLQISGKGGPKDGNNAKTGNGDPRVKKEQAGPPKKTKLLITPAILQKEWDFIMPLGSGVSLVGD